jgi:hypothetical protein
MTTGIRQAGAAGLALVLALALPAASKADLFSDLFGWKKSECPQPSYSCWHYWTPTLVRVSDCLHHRGDAYNHGPDQSDDASVTPFPCPSVNPTVLADLYLNRSKR